MYKGLSLVRENGAPLPPSSLEKLQKFLTAKTKIILTKSKK